MSDIDEPALRSATPLVAAVGERSIGSRELLDLYRDRIEMINPAVNAVVTLDVDRARGAAEAADRAIARGDSLGPLHGLPMTVNDSIETGGLRTTVGAEPFSDHVPRRDAVAVARPRAAGAIVFGKTNLPAFAAPPHARA